MMMPAPERGLVVVHHFPLAEAVVGVDSVLDAIELADDSRLDAVQKAVSIEAEALGEEAVEGNDLVIEQGSYLGLESVAANVVVAVLLIEVNE